jgi:hypothetical protein
VSFITLSNIVEEMITMSINTLDPYGIKESRSELNNQHCLFNPYFSFRFTPYIHFQLDPLCSNWFCYLFSVRFFLCVQAAPSASLVARGILGTETGDGELYHNRNLVFLITEMFYSSYNTSPSVQIGACGYQNYDSEYVVALSHTMFDTYP